MKNKKINLLILAISFSLLVFSYLFVPKVLAQSNFKVAVVPPKQELELNKGETKQVSLKFYNESDTSISGNIKVVDFIVTDSKGTPELLENIEIENAERYSASKWVTLPYERMNISPKDRVEILLTVSAPSNALPGGHYFAVIFEAINEGLVTTPKTGAKPSVSPRLVGLISTTVPGKYSVSAIISDLLAKKFLEYGPIEITGIVKNTGDIHLRPKTYIQLTNVFGKPVDTKINKDVNIFPGAEREYTSNIGQQLMFGKYKVEFNASYANGKLAEAVVYIWVIPWRIIAVVILALIIIYILTNRIISSSKKQAVKLEKELEKDESEIEKLKKLLKNKKD